MTLYSQSYNMPGSKSLYPTWGSYSGGDMLPVRDPKVVIDQEILTMQFDRADDPLTISFPKGFSVVRSVDYRSDWDNDGCTTMIEFIVCRSCFAKKERRGNPFFDFVPCNCDECQECPGSHDDDCCEYEGALKYGTPDWSPESIERFIAEHRDCNNVTS